VKKTILFLSACLLFSACSAVIDPGGGPSEGQGRLYLQFQRSSRSFTPTREEVEGHIDHLDIVALGPSGQMIELNEVPFGTDPVLLAQVGDEVQAGNWSVTVIAKNSEGIHIAQRLNQNILVPDNGVANAVIELEPTFGIGDLRVAVLWEGVSTPSLQGTLQPQGGIATLLDFSSLDNPGEFIDLTNMSSGNYILVVSLYEGAVKVATKVEAVQIFSGVLTSGTISFASQDINTSPGTVGSLSPLNQTGTSLTLQWQTTDPYTKGFILEKEIQGVGGFVEVVRGNAGASGPFGGGPTFSYQESNIQQTTEYNVVYRIRAFNSYGESQNAEWESLTISPVGVPSVSGTTYTNALRPSWSWTITDGSDDFDVELADVNGTIYGPVPLSQETDFTASMDLSEGIYFFRVRQTNPETGWASFTTVVDRTGPTIAELSGANYFNSTFSLSPGVFDPSSGGVSSGIDSYLWSSVTGDVVFSDPTDRNTTITGTADGNYTLRLSVQDRAGNSTFRDFHFVWDTTAPQVSLGAGVFTGSVYDYSTGVIDDLNLSGAQYQWSKVSGPGSVLFGNAQAPSTSMGASQSGDYVIRLTVTDNAGNHGHGDLNFYWDTTPPVVNAGADLVTNGPVALNGSAVDDQTSLSSVASVEWSVLTRPSPTANLNFDDSTQQDTFVNATEDGNYLLRLTAVDGVGLSSSSTMTLSWDTTSPEASFSPVGPQSNGFTLEPVITNTAVNGYASPLDNFQWTVLGGPASLIFDPPNSENPQISTSLGTAEQDGVYTLELVVSDEAGNSSPPVQVSVLIDNNAPEVSGSPTHHLIGSQGFELRWPLASDQGDPQGLQYQIAIAQSEADLFSQSGTFQLVHNWEDLLYTGGGLGYKSISGLSAGTTYFYQVLVRDSAGNQSPYSVGSMVTAGSLGTGSSLVSFSLRDALGQSISALNQDSGTQRIRRISNTVDKRQIIPVFEVSPGARVFHEGTEVFSGVTVLDFSPSFLQLEVRAENGVPTNYNIGLRYRGTEIQDFIIGSNNAFVAADAPGVISGSTITVDIPFRNIAGAPFRANLRASSGSTLSIGAFSFHSDEDQGVHPGNYESLQTTSEVDFAVQTSGGVQSPSFSIEGLGTFRATIRVTAEDGIETQDYDLILQETDVNQIPDGTFIMVTNQPQSNFSQFLYLGAEYNNWGVTWVQKYPLQQYRFITSGAVTFSSINEGFNNTRFELQFLDGNNWTDDVKYNFSNLNLPGRDGSLQIGTSPTDPRILIGNPTVGEDLSPGDVVVFHLLIPNGNTMTLPVDSFIIDRTP